MNLKKPSNDSFWWTLGGIKLCNQISGNIFNPFHLDSIYEKFVSTHLVETYDTYLTQINYFFWAINISVDFYGFWLTPAVNFDR